MKDNKKNAIFAVDLSNIELSDDQRKRIDLGIKEVVLKELAKIDHAGDLVMGSNLDHDQIAKIPKIELQGIWIERFDFRGLRNKLQL